MRTTSVSAAFSMAAIVVFASGVFASLATPAVAQEDGTFQVALKEVADLKAVYGTVESRDTVLARARIGGTVDQLAVDEGSAVKAGDVIAHVKDEKIALELAATDARLAAIDAERKLAVTEFERAEQLRESGAGSQARLDEARTRLDVVARNLAALKAERAVIEQRAKEGAVLAPVSGRVLAVSTAKDQVIMPGEAVARIAAESYILRISLPERHARHMRVGNSVQVGQRGLSTDDAGDMGEVVKVYPEMDRGRVIAEVKVDGLGDYFVGERALVRVETGRRPVYIVPESFLFKRAGLTFARLKDGGEVVVEPGINHGDMVEILSGLRDGDVLLAPEAQS